MNYNKNNLCSYLRIENSPYRWEEFDKLLKEEIDKCRCIKSVGGEREIVSECVVGICIKTKREISCGAKNLYLYLKQAIPEWETTDSKQLYFHMQKMLNSSEKIRKFESGLIGDWLFLFSILCFLLFYGFDYLYYYESAFSFGSTEYLIIKSLMTGFAFINFSLCFLALIFIFEWEGWKREWEDNNNYLQEMLGGRYLNLSSIRQAIVSLDHSGEVFLLKIMTCIWFFTLLWILYYSFSTDEQVIFIFMLLVIFISPIAFSNISVSIRKKWNVYIRNLENFYFMLADPAHKKVMLKKIFLKRFFAYIIIALAYSFLVHLYFIP